MSLVDSLNMEGNELRRSLGDSIITNDRKHCQEFEHFAENPLHSNTRLSRASLKNHRPMSGQLSFGSAQAQKHPKLPVRQYKDDSTC